MVVSSHEKPDCARLLELASPVHTASLTFDQGYRVKRNGGRRGAPSSVQRGRGGERRREAAGEVSNQHGLPASTRVIRQRDVGVGVPTSTMCLVLSHTQGVSRPHILLPPPVCLRERRTRGGPEPGGDRVRGHFTRRPLNARVSADSTRTTGGPP